MVVAAAWPERKRTAEMERTLAETLERERESLARREQHQLELEALKQDREYLELRARDRLDWYREGERVYRIVRPE
jgi:cell division protein FtsB